MRKLINFNKNWIFTKNPQKDTESLKINLPHTWNSIDGQDGGNDYYRGECLYTKHFSKPDYDGEIYLSFDGVAYSARVYLNDNLLCTHFGGFSTFRCNLTHYLKEENILKVFVSNEENDTVYPQRADFTFYGGIYRDVSLICVPHSHFELIKDGTPGIKITPNLNLLENKATITVETYQNNGKVTYYLDNQIKEAISENGYARVIFELNNPHLWAGIDDPYLYSLKAVLDSGDNIETNFGIRQIDIDPNKGFILNGKQYPLRGVSRHQDKKDIGNALSYDDHLQDISLIKEIGANSVRLAHYQHSQTFYDLCDKEGILVWAEIPYITKHMQAGKENTLTQMKELVTQNYNHPCICCWGLSNEITAASVVDDDLIDNHKKLNDLCHSLDQTRKTTMANVFMLDPSSPILNIPDVNAYNLYYGWYLGELSENDEFFDRFHKQYPNKAIGFSEYGADANIAYQTNSPEKGDYSETYQCVYHEHILSLIEKRPWIWSSFVWNMFDFGADGRNEGGKRGENQKGLVTFDRKIKKDAFYLYKSAWSKEKVLHLCGKRYIYRDEDETTIKVYSNLGKVTLYVDNKELETKTGNRVFVFKVKINGKHHIRVESSDLYDEMDIEKVSSPHLDYIFNQKSKVNNWFDVISIDNTCFSIDDTIGELMNNNKTSHIIGEIMKNGASERGDVAKAVTENPALMLSMAKTKLSDLLKQGDADEESVKNINRILQQIKK